MNPRPAGDESFPVRKRPVHLPLLDLRSQNTIIFLTVCTKDRSRVLADPLVHQALREAWTPADQWRVGRYVILPDHVHLFCAPAVMPRPPLKNWITFWKRAASRAIRRKVPDFRWQEDFWDTQLKREDSYAAKWEYVRSNPVRHGLVTSAEDWPYRGEMQVLHGNA